MNFHLKRKPSDRTILIKYALIRILYGSSFFYLNKLFIELHNHDNQQQQKRKLFTRCFVHYLIVLKYFK